MKKRLLLLGSFIILLGVVFVWIQRPHETQAEYGDITLNRYAEEAGMPPVMFPHWFHRIRFKCKVCHPKIFKMRQGANDINMLKIVKGEFCGTCHNGKIAWTPLFCDRCHSGKSVIRIPKSRGFLR